MCSIPPAFDPLRRAYGGATDSVNDIDVDPHGGCAYAASCSGDVLVWDVVTQQLKAQLRHSHWVNAVRCFPLANSAASTASSPPTLSGGLGSSLVFHASSTSAGSPYSDKLYGKMSYTSEIRWVLTGGEDGVVAVWSPMTYRTQSICRLSPSAITALHLLPFTADHAKSGANTTSMPAGTNTSNGTRNNNSNGGGIAASSLTRELDSFRIDDTAFLCAASLQHIHILQVTSTSPELVPLRSLQHTVLITAVTPVRTSAAQPTPLLAVGQEDGTLCLWNCLEWIYHDTLPYPAAEADVEEEAHLSPATVHEPQFEHGAVLNTFAYNRRRCNANSATGAPAGTASGAGVADDVAAPRVVLQDYQRSMPGAISAEAAALVERRCGPLPPPLQYILQLAGPRGSLDYRDPVPLPTELRYDARRITCLASNVSQSQHTSSTTSTGAGSHTQLFTGHATGEVLLWAGMRKDVPFLLLKKIILFRPGTWVWRMCAVRPLITTIRAKDVPAAGDGGKGGKGKPKVLRGKAALNAKVNAAAAAAAAGAASPTAASTTGLNTFYYSPLELVVWSDSGSVEYVSCHNRQVTRREGPGFMASAAACWVGEAVEAKDDGHAKGAAGPVKPPAGAASSPSTSSSSKSAAEAAALSELAVHQYVMMGNFEGRVERYDVSKVMGLVKSVGKVR